MQPPWPAIRQSGLDRADGRQAGFANNAPYTGRQRKNRVDFHPSLFD